MSKRKKKISSKIILSSVVIFFSIILFLSLPVLFNYNSIQNVIEKKVSSEFKINLKINGDIALKVFPRPHYLIKKANLDLNIENDNSSIIETSDLKIFIPVRKIYSKSNIEIDVIELENANIYFNLDDILDFRNHLYYKINKPIHVKKSKFFLLDENKNTILISPLKKIKYLINENNNSKQLKINGNIFDVDYFSFWKRNYENPNETLNEIRLKNPNLNIKNFFSFKDSNDFSGKSSINFLNEDIVINYQMKNNEIFINSPNIKQKIKLNSRVELDPFFFDAKIDIDDKDVNFFINNLLSIIFNSSEDYLGNINGHVHLEINNLKNSIVNKGNINFSIEEKVIKLEKSLFEIQGIGKIKSEFRYYINNGDLIFTSENIFEIENRKEFSRKFQISSKNLKNVKKIYFNLEKNVDSGEISISNIYINKVDKQNFSEKIYLIQNIQTLKALIRDVLS